MKLSSILGLPLQATHEIVKYSWFTITGYAKCSLLEGIEAKTANKPPCKLLYCHSTMPYCKALPYVTVKRMLSNYLIPEKCIVY